LPHNAPQDGHILLDAKLPNGAGPLQRCDVGTAELALEAPHDLASVEATAWKLCQRAGCADFLDWIDTEKHFAWGEDQSEFLR